MVMPEFDEIRREVLIKRHAFFKENGRLPTYVEFTTEMEAGLGTATFDNVGVHVTSLVLNGPRSAFKNFLGMSVTWNAKELRVYGDENQIPPYEEVKLDL